MGRRKRLEKKAARKAKKAVRKRRRAAKKEVKGKNRAAGRKIRKAIKAETRSKELKEKSNWVGGLKVDRKWSNKSEIISGKTYKTCYLTISWDFPHPAHPANTGGFSKYVLVFDHSSLLRDRMDPSCDTFPASSGQQTYEVLNHRYTIKLMATKWDTYECGSPLKIDGNYTVKLDQCASPKLKE